MAHEDLTPSKIITRTAIENVIRVNTAIGGSTNAPIHFAAIARHAGVEHDVADWARTSPPMIVQWYDRVNPDEGARRVVMGKA